MISATFSPSPSAGSLVGAARTLGVNLRRCSGACACSSSASGFGSSSACRPATALTVGGEELVAAARQVDGDRDGPVARACRPGPAADGTVRVATTDTLMGSVLPEVLAGFAAAHPGIRIELAVSNLMASLSKRDADVAIRPARDPPETLVGRRVAKVAFAIYGSPRYLAEHRGGALAAHRWVRTRRQSRRNDGGALDARGVVRERGRPARQLVARVAAGRRGRPRTGGAALLPRRYFA